MTEVTSDTPTDPFIYPHQRAAFDRLCAVARAYIHSNFERLPIQPRGNLFLVGPSGTGKTHLAHAVAKSMNLEFMPISVSEWVVMSASQRSVSSTWPAIWQFLIHSAKKEGCLIFLDELDKIGRHNQGDWIRFQTTEVFSLLDRRIPKNLNDLEGDKVSDSRISDAEKVLNTKTIIVAGGAFQEIWDTPPAIGFSTMLETPVQTPDLKRLSDFIPHELCRRFGSQLVTLPQLQETDYHDMLNRILPSLPSHWRTRYEKLARVGIPEATRLAQGPRFFEEILLEAVVQERLEISSPLQPQPPILSTAHGNLTDIGA
jgi:hypothetical protein